MNSPIRLCFSALLLGFLAPAVLGAQQGRITFNLQGLAAQASENSQVNLDGDMLRMALGSSKNASPQAQAVLSHLQGIYITDLEFKTPQPYPPGFVKAIQDQLSKPDWHIIISDTETNEQTWIAVQRNSEMITAIAIVDIEPKEFAVVNVVGPLPGGLASLSSLGSLGGDLGKLGKLGKLGGGSSAKQSAAPAAPTQ